MFNMLMCTGREKEKLVCVLWCDMPLHTAHHFINGVLPFFQWSVQYISVLFCNTNTLSLSHAVCVCVCVSCLIDYRFYLFISAWFRLRCSLTHCSGSMLFNSIIWHFIFVVTYKMVIRDSLSYAFTISVFFVRLKFFVCIYFPRFRKIYTSSISVLFIIFIFFFFCLLLLCLLFAAIANSWIYLCINYARSRVCVYVCICLCSAVCMCLRIDIDCHRLFIWLCKHENSYAEWDALRYSSRIFLHPK